MSGLVGSVLIPRLFEPSDSGHVTTLLRGLFDEVLETRKGRHWELVSDCRTASLTVVSVANQLHDFEEDLITANALPEDYPEAFVISFGCSEIEDRQLLRMLLEALVDEFDGKASDC